MARYNKPMMLIDGDADLTKKLITEAKKRKDKASSSNRAKNEQAGLTAAQRDDIETRAIKLQKAKKRQGITNDDLKKIVAVTGDTSSAVDAVINEKTKTLKALIDAGESKIADAYKVRYEKEKKIADALYDRGGDASEEDEERNRVMGKKGGNSPLNRFKRTLSSLEQVTKKQLDELNLVKLTYKNPFNYIIGSENTLDKIQEKMSNNDESRASFNKKLNSMTKNWNMNLVLDVDSDVWDYGYDLPKWEYDERRRIMDKAYGYVNYEWTPEKELAGWNGGIKYKVGTTYYGVPYSKHGHSSPDEFTEKIDSYGFDKKYTNRDGDTMPWYGQDCSGLVSDAWGLDRMTTKFMMYAIEDGSMPKLENYSDLKPGDAIVKNGHTRLVAYVEGDKVYTIEQTTGDKAYGTHLDSYSFSDLSKEKYVPITRIGLDETALEESRDRYNNG